MHNLTDKMCPLMGKTCILNGCTMFNERLDGCEISILNYNLYQVKEHTLRPSSLAFASIDRRPLLQPSACEISGRKKRSEFHRVRSRFKECIKS